MKSVRSLLLSAVALFAAGSAHLTAQVPQILNYQGKVAVGAKPFQGTGQFKFALVNATGGTTYWSNDSSSTAGSEPTAAVALPVANGLYNVLLGDPALPNMTAKVPATVFTNNPVFLRVWFNDGATGSQLLAPDKRIASVGYALIAGGLDTNGLAFVQQAAAAAATKAVQPVISQATLDLAAKDATIAALNTKLASDSAASKKSIATLQGQLSDANAAIAGLTKKVGTRDATITSLNSQLATANGQITTLTGEKAQLTTDLAAANATIADLQAQIAALKGP